MRPTVPLVVAGLLAGATLHTVTASPASAGPEAPIVLVQEEAYVSSVSDDARYVFIVPLGGGYTRVDTNDWSSTVVFAPEAENVPEPISVSGDGTVVFQQNGDEIDRRVIGGATTSTTTPALLADTTSFGPGVADNAGNVVAWHNTAHLNTVAYLIDTITGAATEIDTSTTKTYVSGLSADGQLALVAASNGPTGCTATPSCLDVFLYDASDGSLVDLSRATDGSNSEGKTDPGSISPNGMYATFASSAGDLVAGFTTAIERFYRVDLTTGELVVVVEAPSNPSGIPSFPLVTDNGDVYFVDGGPTDYSSHGGPSDAEDAELFRWRDGTTIQISTTPTGDAPNGGVRVPGGVAVAGGVNAVAFTSNASDLAPGVTDSLPYSSWLTEPLPPQAGFDLLPRSVRLLDTRVGATAVDDLYKDIGPRAAGEVFELQVTGRGGIPDGIDSVALNLTSAGAKAVGFATVFACDVPTPGTSNLNYVPGLDVAVATITAVDDDGTVCIFVSAGTELIVDATGTFPDASQLTLFDAPDRYLDSRGGPTFDGQASGGGKLTPNVPLAVPIAGRGDVPSGTTLALVTVTFVDLDGAGFMTTYPCDGTIPGTSTINAVPRANRANLAFAALAADGTLCLRSSVAGHALIDVVGFAPASTTIATINPAERLFETRPGAPTIDGQPVDRLPLQPFVTRTVAIAGRGSVPADVDLVAVNFTITGATTNGWARIWDCTTPKPPTSNINFPAGSSVANLVITGLDADGNLCIDASTTTDAIVDVTALLT